MNGIPTELEEAMVIDGASIFQVFFKMILPLSVPGIVSVSIFNFIQVWNNLLRSPGSYIFSLAHNVNPLYNLKITMNEERKVRDIYTVPDRQKIVYEQNGSELDFTVKEVNGHQMIAICYES